MQEYGPELDKRCRPHLLPTNDSWRVDETYIKVKGQDKYLDRAVDQGNTLDFLRSCARSDAAALTRFFRKMLKALHTQTPRVITVDKNAAYPKAINELKADEELPQKVELRQKKYIYNIVEQDHRGIKRLVKPGMGFFSFNTARRTIRGYEIMNMVSKGQTSWSGERSRQRTGPLHQPNMQEWLHNQSSIPKSFLSSTSFCNTTSFVACAGISAIHSRTAK